MKTLVMTIGTGDPSDLEATLFEPLSKSLADGAWSEVILLPSAVSTPHANEFKRRAASTSLGPRIVVRPLPEDAEYDPDRAYAHFDAVLSQVAEHASPSAIVVDFTRGTKVMSAAVALAGSRHAIHELRYVTGERDRRGTVRPGTETVRTIRADTVDRHRRVDLAREMLRCGDFAAAADLLAALGPDSAPARTVARFYAAWDRLDYGAAVRFRQAVQPTPAPEGWADLWPSLEMLDWTGSLVLEAPAAARKPPPARILRRLIADLIANGERRVAHGHLEDALVRAYRVLELIGQTKLLEHGLDSANLDEKHQAVRQLRRRICKRKQTPLETQDGRLCAARLNVARILKKLKDPLANRLLAYDDHGKQEWKELLDPRSRNRSLLIHGFQAKAGADASLLQGAFGRLEDIARHGWGDDLDADLRIARSVPSQPR